MKSILTYLLIIPFFVSAQISESLDKTETNQQSDGHKKGDIVIMAGIGLGANYGATTQLPPLMLNAEYGVHNMLSLGILAGVSTGKSNTIYAPNGSYYWRYTYSTFAARASFHWGRYLNIPDELDLYGRLALGWRLRTERFVDDRSGSNTEPNAPNANFGLILGIHAGAKYMFMPNMGTYLELGYDNFAPMQLGLVLKL